MLCEAATYQGRAHVHRTKYRCYDLEDSVANHKKGEARGMVVK